MVKTAVIHCLLLLLLPLLLQYYHVENILRRRSLKWKKNQILAAFYSDGQWRELVEHLGAPKSTAYKYTLEREKLDGRGGGQYKKILPVHQDYFVEEIEAN